MKRTTDGLKKQELYSENTTRNENNGKQISGEQLKQKDEDAKAKEEVGGANCWACNSSFLFLCPSAALTSHTSKPSLMNEIQ